MAEKFQLTAELVLAGPTNIKSVVSKLRRDLSSGATNVKVGVDITHATQSIAKLKAQLAGVGGNINIKVNPSIGTSVSGLTTRFGKLNSTLAQSIGNVNSLNAAFSALSSTVAGLNKVQTSSVSSSNSSAKSIQSVQKAAHQASTELEEFGRISGLSLRRLGGYSVAAGLIFGLVKAIHSGAEQAVTFNKEMLRLSQVTKISVNGLRDIETEITRLSTSLGVSSAELLNASTTLAQAELSARDTKIALEALAKSSLAPSFRDINQTTEAAIAIFKQFGLQATDLESVLGSINAVSAGFAVEADDITKAIRIAGSAFANSSKGVKDLSGNLKGGKEILNEFIAAFTSVRATTRASAESIATGLNTISTRIQRPQTIQFLKQFGIELLDLEGKFVGPSEAFARLAEGLGKISPRDTKFGKIVEELGGFRQIRNVIPLITQIGTSVDALSVAQGGQTSLTLDAVVAQQSLANQFAKVREQFLALIRDISETDTFKLLATSVLELGKGLIVVGNAAKPLIPFLTLLAGIKAIGAINQFGKGFFTGVRGGGGARGIGDNLAQVATGTKKTASASGVSNTAINSNTSALNNLTTAIKGINLRGASIGVGAKTNRSRTTPGLPPGDQSILSVFKSGLAGKSPNMTNADFKKMGIVASSQKDPTNLIAAIKRASNSDAQAMSDRTDALSATKPYGPAVPIVGSKPQNIGKPIVSSNPFPKDLSKNLDGVFARTSESLKKFGFNNDETSVAMVAFRKALNFTGDKNKALATAISRGLNYQIATNKRLIKEPATDDEVRAEFAKKFANVLPFIDNLGLNTKQASAAMQAYAKSIANSRSIVSSIDQNKAFADAVTEARKVKTPFVLANNIEKRTAVSRAIGPSTRERAIGAFAKQYASAIPFINDLKLNSKALSVAMLAYHRTMKATGDENQALAAATTKATIATLNMAKDRSEALRPIVQRNRIQIAQSKLARTAAFNEAIDIGNSRSANLNPSNPFNVLNNSFTPNKRTRFKAQFPTFGGIGGKFGGGIGGAGSALLAAGIIEGGVTTTTPGGAATKGAIAGGLGGAGAGALIAGPLGAAVGGLIGAVGGATDAFREAKLKQALDALATSADNVNQSFENFQKTGNVESIESSFAGAFRAINTNIDNRFATAAPRASGFSGDDTANDDFTKGRDALTEARGGGVTNRISSVLSLAGAGISDFFGSADAFKGIEKELQSFQEAQGKELVSSNVGNVRIAQQVIREQLSKGIELFTQDIDSEVPKLTEAGKKFQEAIKLLSLSGPNADKNAEAIIRAKPEDREAVAAQQGLLAVKPLQDSIKAELERAAAFKLLTKEVDLSLQQFIAMSEAIKRASTETEIFSNNADRLVSSLSGDAKVGRLTSNLGNVVSNTGAFSTAEVNKTLENIEKIVGGKQVKLLTEQVKTAKITDVELPKIFADALIETDKRKNDSSLSEEELGSTVLATVQDRIGKLPIGNVQKDALEKSIIEAINSRKGGGDEEQFLSNQKKFSELLGKANEEAIKAVEELAKTIDQSKQNFAAGLDQLTSISVQKGKAFARAQDIRIESELEVRRLQNKIISPDEANQGVIARVKGLAGGLTDPTDILNRLGGLEQKRTSLTSQLDSALPGESEKLGTALKDVNVQIIETKDALELLATDTRKASAIREKLNDLENKGKAGQNLIESLITGGAQDIAKLGRGLQAFNQFRATGQLPDRVEDRRGVLDVLRQIQPLLPQEESRKLEQDFFKKAAQGLGIGNNPNTLLFNEVLKPALNDNGRDLLVQQLEDTTKIQARAADSLAIIATKLEVDYGKLIVTQLETLINNLNARVEGAAIGKSAGGNIFKARGTDTIPAMLTKGEFVVNAHQTKRHRQILEKINSGTMYAAGGGIVKASATQGYPDYPKKKRYGDQKPGSITATFGGPTPGKPWFVKNSEGGTDEFRYVRGRWIKVGKDGRVNPKLVPGYKGPQTLYKASGGFIYSDDPKKNKEIKDIIESQKRASEGQGVLDTIGEAIDIGVTGASNKVSGAYKSATQLNPNYDANKLRPIGTKEFDEDFDATVGQVGRLVKDTVKEIGDGRLVNDLKNIGKTSIADTSNGPRLTTSELERARKNSERTKLDAVSPISTGINQIVSGFNKPVRQEGLLNEIGQTIGNTVNPFFGVTKSDDGVKTIGPRNPFANNKAADDAEFLKNIQNEHKNREAAKAKAEAEIARVQKQSSTLEEYNRQTRLAVGKRKLDVGIIGPGLPVTPEDIVAAEHRRTIENAKAAEARRLAAPTRVDKELPDNDYEAKKIAYEEQRRAALGKYYKPLDEEDKDFDNALFSVPTPPAPPGKARYNNKGKFKGNDPYKPKTPIRYYSGSRDRGPGPPEPQEEIPVSIPVPREPFTPIFPKPEVKPKVDTDEERKAKGQLTDAQIKAREERFARKEAINDRRILRAQERAAKRRGVRTTPTDENGFTLSTRDRIQANAKSRREQRKSRLGVSSVRLPRAAGRTKVFTGNSGARASSYISANERAYNKAVKEGQDSFVLPGYGLISIEEYNEKKGKKPSYMASGGIVPAYLHDGEDVVKRDAAKKHGAMLNAINSNKVQGLATGGPVGGPTTGGKSGGWEMMLDARALDAIATFSSASQGFGSSIEQFGKYVTQLQGIKIPEVIKFKGELSPVTVNFSGDSALAAAVAKEIGPLIDTKIGAALKGTVRGNPLTGETDEGRF